MPWSRLWSRSRTDSFCTIVLTEKCLPTSRRNSRKPSSVSQSALFTSRRGVGTRAIEVEQSLEDATLPGDVRVDLLAREQRALAILARRVADHPGPATDENDRAMSRALPVHEKLDRDEVPDRERVGRRIEAAVADATRRREVILECLLGGALVKEPAPRDLGRGTTASPWARQASPDRATGRGAPARRGRCPPR